MKKLLIITLLLCSIQTFAQYNREIGLNLKTSAYEFASPLFTDFNSGIGIEVFYKKHGTTKTNRFSAAIGIIPDSPRYDWDTIYKGTVSNHYTKGQLTLKKGYEKVLKKDNVDFYFGGDLGLTLFYGNSLLDIISSANGVIPLEKRNTWSGHLVLYPVAGVRIPLKKRFYFTTELTLPFGVQVRNRHYSNGQGDWLLLRETSMFYPKYWIDVIGNIGFSYRF